MTSLPTSPSRARADELPQLAASAKARALAVRAQIQELDPSQLQAVSGGAGGTMFDDYCGTVIRRFPFPGGSGGLGDERPPLINGRWVDADEFGAKMFDTWVSLFDVSMALERREASVDLFEVAA